MVEIIIAITGHRPNKLPNYSYDLRSPKWQALQRKYKTFFKTNNCTEVITGMALGVDQCAALAVIELKSEGYDIKLHAAIPCRNQEKIWPKQSQELYHAILSKADIIKIVTDSEYTPVCMQIRNIYMVDHADQVLAVWDGTAGGTKNCIDYAKKKQKTITIIQP